jgi:hypothetical protein
MARREVYASTGTRLMVRVFAGFNFAAEDVQRHDFAKYGYQKGVPMGGDLTAAPSGKSASHRGGRGYRVGPRSNRRAGSQSPACRRPRP